jgi:hypothetical protein
MIWKMWKKSKLKCEILKCNVSCFLSTWRYKAFHFPYFFPVLFQTATFEIHVTYFSSILSISFHNFLLYFPYHFTFQLTFLPHFPYHFTIFFCIFHIFSLFINEKAWCKTIQLKLANTDLSLTHILHVTIGLQNILEGCRRAMQLNMSLLVGDW